MLHSATQSRVGSLDSHLTHETSRLEDQRILVRRVKEICWTCADRASLSSSVTGRMLLHLTGLEEIAQKGREQREDSQSSSETPGDPSTKEELVESEYGGGQDTEPLRPSSTGMPTLKF